MSRVPDHAWIKSRLQAFTAISDDLRDIATDSSMDNEYGPLTALKLFLLAAGVDVYSNIATEKFEYTYYIDALAGCGGTRIKDRDEWIVGSPIIAATIPRTHFSEYHFIEQDGEKAGLLEERLDYVDENTGIQIERDRCHVHTADANEKIPELMDKLKQQSDGYYKGANTFAFIDNEGPDLHWSSIEELTKAYGDLLITHPATSISRRRGQSEERKKEVDRYYGTNAWRETDGEAELKNLYLNRLEGVGRPITESVRINSREKSKRFYYDSIFATRDTPGGSPYTEAITNMKNRIERFSGEEIKRSLDVLKGQATLGDVSDDVSTQSGLDQFHQENEEENQE